MTQAEKKIEPKAAKKTTISRDGNNQEIRNMHRGNDIKEMFVLYICEKGLMNISRRTGYNWLQENQKNLIDQLEGKVDANDNLTENRGRKKLLTADHKRHLEGTFGENFPHNDRSSYG